MIPNQWYAVLESSEVRREKPVGVTRLGEKLAFWRDATGRVACLRDQCAHRGAALSTGKVVHGNVQCPFHGFEFDATGRCRLIPANGRVAEVPRAFLGQAYTTREAHGFIWVWWGEQREDLPPLPFFHDLGEGFSYATFRDHWKVHYSRAIENQLDVVHLPFVHRSTIGRGGRTVVDGPLVRENDDGMSVWVYNRTDDGTPAKRASQLPEPTRDAFLEFRFPNLWQLKISPAVRIFVAFAPIDEENCLLYMRYYQSFVRLPLIRWLASLAGMLSGIVILRQDKPVVATQRPKKTDLTLKEKLIPGDRPVVAYRARRQQLLGRAAGEEGGDTR